MEQTHKTRVTDQQMEAGLNYFSRIAVHLVPGFVVLEVTFDRGFFAGNVQDWIRLVLLVVWAAILSLPFEVGTFAIRTFLVSWKDGLKDDPVRLNSWNRYQRAQIQFLFMLPLILLYYVGDKLLRLVVVLDPASRYVATVTIMLLSSWLIAKPFAWTVQWIRREAKPTGPPQNPAAEPGGSAAG